MKNNLKIVFQNTSDKYPLLQKLASIASCKAKLSLPCYVNLMVCNNEEIKIINYEHRNIDNATDVLSFPELNYKSSETILNLTDEELLIAYDVDMNAVFLGDIIISNDKAKEQADEFGHSFDRELGYLFVHGLCHLFGFDHIEKEDKKLMRNMEESILSGAGQVRIDKEELFRKAAEAMEFAYVPYSKYKVGACLLTKSGKMFTGCNVENASYGLTNCSERTAVFKAVSEGYTEFSALAIVSQKGAPWPCGACRQVLSEFCPDLPIYVKWKDGETESTLSELLPHSFSPYNGIQNFVGKD